MKTEIINLPGGRRITRPEYDKFLREFVAAITTIPVFCAGQRAALNPALVEGRDFICYEQVPTRPGDLIFRNGRWVDRRTTDGEILAADGRNAI